MKLYTEEQVLKFINDNFDEGCSQLIGLTPIELPSDEEIWVMSGKYTEKCGLKNFFDEDVIKKHWVQAYKSAIKDFQINKIQGGNNEQQ